MQNINLFEVIGVESDPVYKKVASLQVGDVIEIDGIQVRLSKFYEVESEIEHLPFPNMMSCYRHLSDILVKQVIT